MVPAVPPRVNSRGKHEGLLVGVDDGEMLPMLLQNLFFLCGFKGNESAMKVLRWKAMFTMEVLLRSAKFTMAPAVG